jgi:hypothetical protein
MNKFLKISTWKMIIHSRIINYKNSKTDWCKERRKICAECNNNSVHHPTKTLKQYFLRLMNMGEYCKICFCSIKYKCSVPYTQCSMTELNELPKWQRVNIKR